jgi:serine phosphatase RsbU (regulator of sigma subunit)
VNQHVNRSRPLDPLPAKVPKIHGATVAAVYYGQRRAGDFYDFLSANEQRVWLALFDVAGRLETNRAVVVALQEKFRACAPALVAETAGNDAEAVIHLWLELNQAVLGSAGKVHSCPAFVACYQEQAHTFCYINGGHTPGLVRLGQEIRELTATAVPLGLFSHSLPECSIVALGKTDAVLLLSRGIVDAQHRGEAYGIERATQYLLECSWSNARELCLGILSRVRDFMQTTPTHDDVTALALVRSRSESP